MEYQEKVNKILDWVDREWRANDGGATHAAGEVYRLASHCVDVLERYSSGQISLADAYEMTGPFAQSTGAEQDICCATQEEIRRISKEMRPTSGEGWTLNK